MMRPAFLVSFVLLGSCSSTLNLVRIGDVDGEITAALDQAWQQHFTATRAKDAAAASALYTDDALYAITGERALRGRSAIEAMEKAGMQNTEVADLAHSTQALRVDGTVAHEIGTVSGDVAAGGAPATTVVFDYVAEWHREADGSWRIAHLVGHFANAATTAGTAAPAATACDLRPQFDALGLAPRSQGPRPTCSIFTTVAVIEFAVARATGTPVRLSVEYCNWAANAATGRRDDGDFFHFALQGFERFGICRDELWPYGKAFAPDALPSPDALVDSGRRQAAVPLRVRWIRPIDGKPGLSKEQFDDVLSTLRDGWPVAAGSGHSRVLVGYRDDANAAGGGTFVTLDSALGRFDEVPAAWVREQVNDAFVVAPAERL